MSEKQEDFTRHDLIEAVYAGCALTKADAGQAVTHAIAAIKQAVQSGRKVSIREFLTIETKDAAERQGRNPKTGEAITIPAHKRVVAKAKFSVE